MATKNSRVQSDCLDTLLAIVVLAFWVVLIVVVTVDTTVDSSPEDARHPHSEMPE